MATAEELVNRWIVNAFEQGASDIHIEPDKNDKIRVRVRLDGSLKTIETVPDGRRIMSRLKVMAELDLNEKGVPMDGRIDVAKNLQSCAGLSIRLSTLPCTQGEKAVLRLVDNRRLNMTLDQLGFTQKMYAAYGPLVDSPHGLILHVGPTGSGKTTSLYSVLQTLKKKDVNIQTVENPVEYDVFGVTQTQVNHELGLSFPKVLRALLRQDPDVILVGEIRDTETAEIAVEAAMTGHLVLSTLHTNDAVGTVVRLHDMGVAPFCIAYALRCVVSQRFVRMLCEKCKRSVQPPERVVKVTGSNRPIWQAQGCNACQRSGYKGRVPLFEFLPNSAAFRTAIYGSVTPDVLGDVAAKNGLISLWQDGLDKVHQGMTSLEELLRAVKGVREASPVRQPARPRVPLAPPRRPGAPPSGARPSGGAPRPARKA